MITCRELLVYGFLISQTVFLLIVWIPLCRVGRVTLVEPSIIVRYSELIALYLILMFAVIQLITRFESLRKEKKK